MGSFATYRVSLSLSPSPMKVSLLALAALVFTAMASASGPKGIDYAAIASNDHKVYYISKDWYRSRDEPSYFYSLDFGTAWPVSAPAWTKLVYNNASLPSIFGRTKVNGLSKDGSLLYVPGRMEPVRVYDIAEAEWEQEVKQDEYKDRPSINSIMVLDPDNEVIYGIDDEMDRTTEFAPPGLSLSLCKYEIRTGQTSRERIKLLWMDFSDIQMVVHSSARENFVVPDRLGSCADARVPHPD